MTTAIAWPEATDFDATVQERESAMLREYQLSIPASVREELEAAGFKPTLDAGNLWYLDKGSVRLTFGEDGSDLPQSMTDECDAFDMTSDELVGKGPLRLVLELFAIGEEG